MLSLTRPASPVGVRFLPDADLLDAGFTDAGFEAQRMGAGASGTVSGVRDVAPGAISMNPAKCPSTKTSAVAPVAVEPVAVTVSLRSVVE